MKKLLVLAFWVLLAASCTQDTELSITPDIASFQFDAEGGSFDVVIFTNGSWTASCEDPAVSFSPASGECTLPMHIEVARNDEFYTKAIRITLSSTLDALTRASRIVITQACAPFIFCEEPERQVGGEGGIVRFSVNANAAWHVASGAPCPVSPQKGGPNRTEVSLVIPENAEGVARTFEVRLDLDDASGAIAPTVTLKVIQQG